MSISVALDTSIGFALAARRDDRLLVLAAMPGMGRESDRLLTPWVMQKLAKQNIAIQDVTHWTLGTGPGSFAGLRCGIAMVKGIVAVTGAAMRGVPSAYALAVQAATLNTTRIGVLHDGRCGQVLFSCFGREPDSSPRAWKLLNETLPLDPKALLEPQNACDIYVTCQADALPELPAEVSAKLQSVSGIDASTLDLAPEEISPWPTDSAAMERSTEPLYVRQAVFVKPAELRRE